MLTYYDGATGERTELSATDLGGWVSRTASLLRDGCGLGPQDRIAVLLPPHWQTAAVLLGAWSAGVPVSLRLAATAGLPALGPDGDAPVEATFVARRRLDDWLENVPEAHYRFVLGLAPAAAPLNDIPEGYRDYVAEVARHPVSGEPVRFTDDATYEEWGLVARELAERQGLHRGDRLLVDTAEYEHPINWLLAPLSAGASVVLCANLDQDRLNDLAAAEQATHIL